MKDVDRFYLDSLLQDYRVAQTDSAKSLAAARLATAYQNLATRAVSRDEREMLLNNAENWLQKGTGDRIPASASDKPSCDSINAMKSIPTLGFSDIGGFSEVKRTLLRNVILSEMKDIPDAAPQNILLYGPPGCGKTSLVMALAGELEKPLYLASLDKTLSKWHGESSQIISSLYDAARKEEGGRALIFLDDCEVQSGDRSSAGNNNASNAVVTSLLAELDGVNSKSSPNQPITICACNNPQMLDSAFLSRMKTKIYIPLPDVDATVSILNVLMRCIPRNGYMDVRKIAATAVEKRYGGRELEALVARAKSSMIEDMNPDFEQKYLSLSAGGRKDFSLKFRPLEESDFLPGFSEIRSAVTDLELKKYELWNNLNY